MARPSRLRRRGAPPEVAATILATFCALLLITSLAVDGFIPTTRSVRCRAGAQRATTRPPRPAPLRERSVESEETSGSSTAVEEVAAESAEGVEDEAEGAGGFIFDESLISLPRHPDNDEVNRVLSNSESVLQGLLALSTRVQDQMNEEESLLTDNASPTPSKEDSEGRGFVVNPNVEEDGEESARAAPDRVFANSYVDLGRVDTVGFDYDYTLVTYRKELLELIYDMSLRRLVRDKCYPAEMESAGLKFDPGFSIRGLAVDRKTGWICHLSYTHKVAVAWEGRNQVDRSRLMEEYSGKRALHPRDRKKRLKPLNDLFSMAECCLIADTVQFFNDNGIPFSPRQTVNDVLSVIGGTHISGDFHRLVAKDPGLYFDESPHLKSVLENLKSSGKRLIFVSNSPYWYVDAGMRHVIGDGWRDMWDAVVVSAGKPVFYTADSKPFREVSKTTGRVKFKEVRV